MIYNSYKSNFNLNGYTNHVQLPFDIDLNSKPIKIAEDVFNFPVIDKNGIYFCDSNGSICFIQNGSTIVEPIARIPKQYFSEIEFSTFTIKKLENYLCIFHTNGFIRLDLNTFTLTNFNNYYSFEDWINSTNRIITTNYSDYNNPLKIIADNSFEKTYWSSLLQNQFSTFSLIFENQLIYNDGFDTLLSINVQDYSKVWSINLNTEFELCLTPHGTKEKRRITGFPLIASDTLVLGITGGELVFINCHTGKVIKRISFAGTFSPTNYSFDERENAIYVSCPPNFYKIDLQTLEVFTKKIAPSSTHLNFLNTTQFSFSKNFIYCSDANLGSIYRINKEMFLTQNVVEINTLEIEGKSLFPIHVSDNELFILSEKGTLIKLIE